MSRRTRKTVGVIGLGIIGQRVAHNLRRRGFQVFVWNRTPQPVPNFVGSPGELAELCDFVQIFVSDDDALLDMVQQMTSTLTAHHVVMAHSTVAPDTMRAAAEIVQRRGAQFLDAPFTGSKMAAENGELIYYVGGDDAALKRVRHLLEASSSQIIEIGEIGQASTIKIATNLVTVSSVQSAAEALALVYHSGVSPEKLAAAMRDNASHSKTLAMKLPKMAEGDFDAHFSVKHMLKDVQIAARMARSLGLDFGAAEAARASLLQEIDEGGADRDYSSIARKYFPDGAPLQPEPEEEPADDLQATLALVTEKVNHVEERQTTEEIAPATPAVEAASFEPIELQATIPGIIAVEPEESPLPPEDRTGHEVVTPEPEDVFHAESAPEPALEQPEGAMAGPKRIALVPRRVVKRSANMSALPEPPEEEVIENKRGLFSRLWRRGSDY